MKDHILAIVKEGYRIYNPFTGKTIGTGFNTGTYLVWRSEQVSGAECKEYKTFLGAFKNWDLNQ